MKTKIILSCFCCFFVFALKSQSSYIHPMNYDKDGLSNEYVILGDTSQVRPLIVYCMGSLPIPLFRKEGDNEVSFIPFYYPAFKEKYHIAIVSKKGIPIVAKREELNEKEWFVDPQTKQLSTDFTQNNNLTYYTDLHNRIINELSQKSFVDTAGVLIVGHSAGARVAARVASTNAHVSHLAYLSCEPQGRFYQILREKSLQSENRSEAILSLLDYWKSINANYLDKDMGEGDSPMTWHSNSINVVPDLLVLDMPVLAAHGTHDSASEGMIVIPYEFARYHKNNLTYLPYENLDHSYYFVDKNGKVDYDRYYFHKIIENVIDWWQKGISTFDLQFAKE